MGHNKEVDWGRRLEGKVRYGAKLLGPPALLMAAKAAIGAAVHPDGGGVSERWDDSMARYHGIIDDLATRAGEFGDRHAAQLDTVAEVAGHIGLHQIME